MRYRRRQRREAHGVVTSDQRGNRGPATVVGDMRKIQRQRQTELFAGEMGLCPYSSRSEVVLARIGPDERDYFTRAIEGLLIEGQRFDDTDLKLTEAHWTRAVDGSGYVAAQRLVSAVIA